jgi:hypothetical protein
MLLRAHAAVYAIDECARAACGPEVLAADAAGAAASRD